MHVGGRGWRIRVSRRILKTTYSAKTKRRTAQGTPFRHLAKGRGQLLLQQVAVEEYSPQPPLVGWDDPSVAVAGGVGRQQEVDADIERRFQEDEGFTEADDFRICQVPVWASYVGIGNPTIPSILNCRITTLFSPPLSDTSPCSPALCHRHHRSAYRQSGVCVW